MGGKKGGSLCFEGRSVPWSGSQHKWVVHCCTGEEAKGWERDGRREGTPAACIAAYSNICKTVPKSENYYGFEAILKINKRLWELHLPVSFITAFPVKKITFNPILQMWQWRLTFSEGICCVIRGKMWKLGAPCQCGLCWWLFCTFLWLESVLWWSWSSCQQHLARKKLTKVEPLTLRNFYQKRPAPSSPVVRETVTHQCNFKQNTKKCLQIGFKATFKIIFRKLLSIRSNLLIKHLMWLLFQLEGFSPLQRFFSKLFFPSGAIEHFYLKNLNKLCLFQPKHDQKYCMLVCYAWKANIAS